MVANDSEAVQKLFGSGGTTNPKPAASTADDAIIAMTIQSHPENLSSEVSRSTAQLLYASFV